MPGLSEALALRVRLPSLPVRRKGEVGVSTIPSPADACTEHRMSSCIDLPCSKEERIMIGCWQAPGAVDTAHAAEGPVDLG